MELKESRIAKNAKYLSPCRILTIHMLWGPLKKNYSNYALSYNFYVYLMTIYLSCLSNEIEILN